MPLRPARFPAARKLAAAFRIDRHDDVDAALACRGDCGGDAYRDEYQDESKTDTETAAERPNIVFILADDLA